MKLKEMLPLVKRLQVDKVKLLVPPLSTLVVGSTREKVGDFVPLLSVSLYGLDELNTLCVHPMAYMRPNSERRLTMI